MSRKSCEVQKTLVRNAEQPLKPIRVRRSDNFTSKENEKPQKPRVRYTLPGISSQKSSEDADRFKRPELHSTLLMRQRMEVAAKEKVDKMTVDPSLLAASKEEIAKKLNFNRYTTVYKNLQPLNVNDISLIESRSRKKNPIKTPRDPIPNPSDYLKPIPSFTVPEDFVSKPVKIQPLKSSLGEENCWLYKQQNKMMKHFGLI